MFISAHRRLPALLALAAAAAVATGASLAAAQPARALDLAVCNGLINVRFTPALTNTTKPTAIEEIAELSTCVSTGGISSGRHTLSAMRSIGCTTTFTGGPGTLTLRWDTGQTSTVSYISTSQLIGGQTYNVREGSVTSGLFQGAGIRSVFPAVSDLTLCATTGVPNLTGDITLTIFRLL